ncbi:flagellar hook-basal body complex protein FliE [Halarcobacter mediterraneus]|uniref:Flagellar hook-basal body complex protein FliE n=1 Tax=Halarcobacter mediterraneus TaxID=2023153 RepID=A0A4Q1AR17_9BACT|nr:flagellar hook-basal body complex protein FliE [Halarcobacter mediterraneus]RXK11892.1 flagellar hook-basal body complex protein FliE [Halarcobacter mediterraneus]
MNISSITDSIGSIGTKQNNQVNQKENDLNFQDMLKNAITEVNDAQVQGYDAMEGIATGKVKNLQEAVQKIEEADLSLKLGLEVKNKAINAYKEIMKMQV